MAAYYTSQGYEKSYQRAYHDDAPFTPLSESLPQSRAGLLTTGELAIRHLVS
ncbi:MAG: hypothetical protein GKR94_27335 [Gammaproteobacteria bacterium]|nr:hypothetical protein [Gammaproteobacteria bacterium]